MAILSPQPHYISFSSGCQQNRPLDTNQEGVKADKVLEINPYHPVFKALETASEEKLGVYAKLLYDQALLIEGLPIDDPVEFSNNICSLMQ